MDQNHVLRWLRAVPDGGDLRSTRKRPRPSDSTDASLPTRSDQATMETPDKRRRTGPSTSSEPAAAHAATEEDQTPRPRGPHQGAAFSRTASTASLSSSIPGHVSGSNNMSEASSSNTSARRKRKHMQLGPDPVRVMSFMGKGVNGPAARGSLLPEALDALLLDFKKAKAGALPIISRSRRDEIRSSDQAGEDIFENHFLPDGAGQDQVESPPLDDVIRIMRTAGEYAALRYDEHAWNCGVHFPLLRLAIPENSLLKIVPWQFLPASVPNGKMVDFCLAVDPYWPFGMASSTPASAAVDVVRLSQPGYSIGHTTYMPLAQYPIALSIETKRPDGSGDEAEAQLGVWQTAQWRTLEAMVCHPGPASQGSGAAGDAGPAANPGACLEELGFLPAIYTVGHYWRFAATTRDPESGRTTLWTDQDFGSTADALGIYRIVWGLRRLQKFLTETYWPWYQKYVLGMESDG